MERFPLMALAGVNLLLIGFLIRAEDWSQWRGPERSGLAVGKSAPENWPDELTELWKVKVGEGHSSPVLEGARVYQFARADGEEVLYCLNVQDGKELWHYHYEAPYEVNPAAHQHGKGPKATPTVADGRVYLMGINGTLTCVRASDGQLQWRKTYGEEFKETAPLYGAASSPLVARELCIVQVGGHDEGAIVAIHAKTGEEKWRCPIDGPGYASCVAVNMTGEHQIITQTQTHLVGLRLESGETLWKRPFKTEYDQNIITPVIHQDRVIFSGYGQPLMAGRIELTDQGFHFRDEWNNKNHSLYMSTPVVRGNLLFGMSHRLSGHLFCVDASTGSTQWQTKGRFGDNAAIILLGDVLLIQNTEGQLFIVRATGAKYELLREYTVADSPTWATPALDGRRLFVKDRQHLRAYRLGN